MRPRYLSALFFFLLAAASAGIWYFAYGLSPSPPDRAYVSGLGATANVRMHEDGVVAITAGSPGDAYRALGFAHGAHRAWPSLLLRQAALGRLSLWFGDDAAELDGHVAALRTAELAREAFASLDDADRVALESFADGINAALRHRRVATQDPVVVLRVRPEPWEAWHTLAIERLFAWFTLESADADALPTAAAAFMANRNRLLNSLGIGGFDRSATWAFRRADVTYLYYRLVHGRSAIPYFLDAHVNLEGDPVTGVLLAGTPFFLAGKTSDRTWALLPRTTMHVGPAAVPVRRAARVLVASVDLPDRDAAPRASERLASYRVDPSGNLVFPDDDSGFVAIEWAGFSPTSDASAFRALFTSGSPLFRLLDPLGLTLSRSGLWTTIGPAEWHNRFAGGVLIERSPWTRYHVERLNTLIRGADSLALDTWSSDAYSPWAAAVVPRLLDVLEGNDTASPSEEAATTYLRNWDFEFSRSSIAASIFDEWAATYAQRRGRIPAPETIAADSLFQQTAIASFTQSVDELQRSFGPDLSTWRWERSQATAREHPFWTFFDGARRWFAETRYAPSTPLGIGHPSALAWGATSDPGGDPPARWDVLFRSDRWDHWKVQRSYPAYHDVSSFEEAIADFESSGGSVPSEAPVRQSTTLEPSR